jgi:DNA-damage-inducible protein J
MKEQVLVQTRIDRALKEEVAEIYAALGLDLPTAIRMFFIKSKMSRGIPFETVLPESTMTRADALTAFAQIRNEAASVPEMTLDEINKVIAETRATRKARQDEDIRRN